VSLDLRRLAWTAASLGAALGPGLACEGIEPTTEHAPLHAAAGPAPVAPTQPSELDEPALADAVLPSPATPPPWRDGGGALIDPDHWLPGPARRSEPARAPSARLALDEGCRRCHTRAAHEHLGSQHAGAWSSDAFQHAFRREPRAFCQRCHAPEEDAAAKVHEVSPAAASLGVGCVTCHVQPGTDVVWAAPAEAGPVPAPAARSPHPIARSALFAGPQACAGCHEFPFPDEALREHPLAMQSTITEHARSAAADRSCADCHMPRDADGDRSHAFPGAYDRAMLAQALEIEATRPTPTTVRILLRPGEVGHAVPTGDLLRRILLEVRVDGPTPDAPRFSARRFLGRRYGPLHQPSGITVRGELGDERVGPAGHAASFVLPEAHAAAPVRWRLVHQRVAQHRGDPRRAPIDGEIEFASGVLSSHGPARAQ
jgi:hypothetical protein